MFISKEIYDKIISGELIYSSGKLVTGNLPDISFMARYNPDVLMKDLETSIRALFHENRLVVLSDIQMRTKILLKHFGVTDKNFALSIIEDESKKVLIYDNTSCW